MKFTVVVFISIFFMGNNYALSGPLKIFEDGLDKFIGKPIDSGLDKLRGEKKKTPIQLRVLLAAKKIIFLKMA